MQIVEELEGDMDGLAGIVELIHDVVKLRMVVLILAQFVHKLLDLELDLRQLGDVARGCFLGFL